MALLIDSVEKYCETAKNREAKVEYQPELEGGEFGKSLELANGQGNQVKVVAPDKGGIL